MMEWCNEDLLVNKLIILSLPHLIQQEFGSMMGQKHPRSLILKM